MSGVVVRYADISIGAKQSFDLILGDGLPSSNLDLMKEDNAIFKRYDIPLELNSMILDGASDFLPEDSQGQIGFISQQMTDENGNFQTPVVVEFASDVAVVSVGLTLKFDEIKNIYATRIKIQWYDDNGLLAEEDFYPNSNNYFCNKLVQYYKRFVITFYSLNVPFNHLRLNQIDYGLKVEFTGNELRSAKIIQEIDPISTSIPINPFDFVVDNKKDIELTFQVKQPLEVLFDNEVKATTFIKSAKRKSKTTWQIQSEDYIGLMDTIYFQGGIYTKKNAIELLREIFSVAKVPYSIAEEFNTLSVTGYIPYCTCREALMQVVFAIGGVADTSGGSGQVSVFALNNVDVQTIPQHRILQGQNFEEQTRITAVELMAHIYTEIQDTLIAYESSKSGTGTNIFVSFTQPLHDLTITNGTINEYGVNYAIINANEGCVLIGKKFDHSKVVHRKNNPSVLLTDIENVIAIENATLVSADNVDNLLNICYNYLVNAKQTNMKIIDGKKDVKTMVGDLISFETEYLGTMTGRIIKQSYALVGGILVKDSIVR